MDSLTEKILEVSKLLKECYETKKGTRTKDLARVLPSYPALKELKEATKDLLELWDFYRSWQFGRKLEREWKKEDKTKMKKTKQAGLQI